MKQSHQVLLVCGCFSIEPCLLICECTKWLYPLNLISVICGMNHTNIVYGTASSLNWLWKRQLWIFANNQSKWLFTWRMVVWTSILLYVLLCWWVSRPCFSAWFRTFHVVSCVIVELFGRTKEMQPLHELINCTQFTTFRRLDTPPFIIKIGSHQLKWCVTFRLTWSYIKRTIVWFYWVSIW